MITASRTGLLGVRDGKMILIQFLGDDQEHYDVALTLSAATEALDAIFRAAQLLPVENARTVKAAIFQGGSVELAVGEKMQPLLVLRTGGMEIPIQLSKQQLDHLSMRLSEFLSGAKH